MPGTEVRGSIVLDSSLSPAERQSLSGSTDLSPADLVAGDRWWKRLWKGFRPAKKRGSAGGINLMSDSRSIQPYGGKVPAGAIMTPQGPAIIQVIDMPTGDLALGQGGSGFKPQKPAGMHIFGAVLRALVAGAADDVGHWRGRGVFAGKPHQAQLRWSCPR